MEDSGEGHSEDKALPGAHSEDKALPDTNKKRRFKTPSQVQALEDFYNEQKYPTDLMKAELAEKLGLTEKQISGWFCHRRLKDRRLLTEETQATGRQDLSGGVAQDQGSGLRQDSCGSTKRGDYKPVDLREVESRRLYDDDFPPTEIHHGQRGDYGVSEGDDDTSSESDSDLQDGFHPRGKDIADMDTSQYGMPNGLIPQSRGRVGPSGYLKIKGQVENVAITAVKRQLGRYYREDGPPLGVDFDPLPPDAFESHSRSVVHAAERSIPIPLDVRGARWPPTLKNDLYVGAAKPKLSHGSDEDILPYQRPLKKKSNGGSAGFSRKPSFSTDEHSGGETSVYDGIMNPGVKSKHAAQGMKSDPLNYPRNPSGGKTTVEQTEPWLHNYDAMNPKAGRKRAGLESKFSSLKYNYKDSLAEEELMLPSRIRESDEVSGDRRAMRELQDPVRSRHSANEKRATKGARGFPRPDFAAGLASHELPQLTKQFRGSAVEMPSSFSEDETAETSSSVD